MKVLLLDVGNSRIKWGVGEGGEVSRTGAVTMQRVREDGIGVLTHRLPSRVDAAMASNVAGPSTGTRLAGLVGAHTGHELRFAHAERSACGVSNGYRQPRRLGVDRWVAMIGAWQELQRACLVVDAGTAVTIDALDDEGRHLGGQILPGAGLMAASLAQNTAEVGPPAKSRAAASAMFGKSTRAAVGNGALNAVCGAVERAINALRSTAYDPDIVLTGGDSSRILQALGEEALHRPNLVLQGLLRLHESGNANEA